MALIRGNQISGSVASASYALTASYALNAETTFNTGSLVTTSSFNAFTSSYNTGSFSGSFYGDGSNLTGIVSSKWTGSNPITRDGNVIITGSLIVSGAIGGIDTLGTFGNGKPVLFDQDGVVRVQWINGVLIDASGVTSINWGDERVAYDGAQVTSLAWGERVAADSAEVTSLDWENRAARDSAGNVSLDWENKYLYGTASFAETSSISNQILTRRTSSNSTFYPTMVDSANSSPDYETVYTSQGITFNPGTSGITANSFTGSLLGTAASSSTIITTGSNSNATFFLTFVDSNNTSSAQAEILYTAVTKYDGVSITVNPFNGAISAPIFSGNLTGNVTGTSSFATTATTSLTSSLALRASGSLTGSLLGTATTSLTSSLALRASGSLTGSLLGTATTASYVLQAVSSSFASTASFVTASNVYGPYGSNSVISASYASASSFSNRTTQIDLYVLNQSGNNIEKGVVVRITGSNNSSDIPRIVTASYENDNNSANTLGITTTAIANGAEGFVITAGILIGVDTQAFTSGQLIYLGATGSIIGTAPVAPLNAVRLGEVIRQQSNNGSIYVRIDNGYEIGELHDVQDTTTTSSYGDLLIKSGSVWTNSKQLTGSYGLTGSLDATQITASNLYAGNAYILGSFSGSFTGSLFGTSSWASNAITASFVTASNVIGTVTSASFASTASYIRSPLSQDLTINGTLNVTALNATTSSIQYITSSQLNISTNLIKINTTSPLRYGGIEVVDSGSLPFRSGSLLFDSQNNQWIFVHQNIGGATTSSVLIMGPQTFNNVGNETTITANRLTKGTGGDLGEHIGNSNITDTGTIISINSNSEITGSLNVSTTINATSITASFSGDGSGLTNLPNNAYLGQIQALNQIMYNF